MEKSVSARHLLHLSPHFGAKIGQMRDMPDKAKKRLARHAKDHTWSPLQDRQRHSDGNLQISGLPYETGMDIMDIASTKHKLAH